VKIRSAIILSSLLLLIANISFAADQNTFSEVGRYQIFISPLARADVYLVDTKTGKVWINTQYTDVEGQPKVWKYQERIDSNEDLMQWIKQQKIIKPKE
jgi:hypothetical protein